MGSKSTHMGQRPSVGPGKGQGQGQENGPELGVACITCVSPTDKSPWSKELGLNKAKGFDLLQDLKMIMWTESFHEDTHVFPRSVSYDWRAHLATQAKTKALDLFSNLSCSGGDETRRLPTM